MTTNENLGSVPDAPEDSAVFHHEQDGPGSHPTEQPVTIAGGVVGPLETAEELSEKSEAERKRPTPN